MIRFFLVPCLILMLGIRMPMAQESPPNGGSIEGAKGFGIGALVGALVGGPVGALVGAAGGAIVAEQGAAKDRNIDALEAKLDERTSEIADMKSGSEQTQVALSGDMSILDRRPDAPLSMAVYFRTDDADIDASVHPHLERLGVYLESHPDLKVRLEGHSDARGDIGYNFALSQRRIDSIRHVLEQMGIAPDRIHTHAYGEARARAQADDVDAMVFDRAVIISIGDSQSDRA